MIQELHHSSFSSLLNLKDSPELSDLLEQSLFSPLNGFIQRPSKRFRARLVELGYSLGRGSEVPSKSCESRVQACAQALESIHAGSLIVDDIEDASAVRRGVPTLHLQVGLPIALNAGNWLYFWPMELIRRLELPAETELHLYQLCHRALLRAHFGQALDVGVPIDTLPQSRISEVCLASLELKSGALTALALSLGAALGSPSQEMMRELDQFGHDFGVALQMFDDLGNLTLDPAKRYEDLRLRRPSGLWAFAASESSAESFNDFLLAVRQLPDDRAITAWVGSDGRAKRARQAAISRIQLATQRLQEFLEREQKDAALLMAPFKELEEKLIYAYNN